MNLHNFDFGFWHPFGPYCDLSGKQILDWKAQETSVHGWTFWSFAYTKSLEVWAELLATQATMKPVYVFCSHNPAARDPASGQNFGTATHYQFVTEHKWNTMPDRSQMYVTNPFKSNGMASAFKVQHIHTLEVPIQPSLSIEWFGVERRQWRSDALPTRGQYAVRPGGTAQLRSIAAVLELSYPYFATLKHAPVST